VDISLKYFWLEESFIFNFEVLNYYLTPSRQARKNQDTKRFTKSFHHAIMGRYKSSQTKK
jgi:hypothetical protein